ncbi:ATPase family AAA domain protein 3A (macronuclear) [Tetrahymena thermophila SB210]|uniref:ATPase family AAA domain protein 3A n=1 Tax=Tetrahymena thermophila (strain SB210) TaxID=312017 RepID=W7XJ16_TETTS|nr:ATPase family AAA domain protein 3A [Tetrahymena thermophila SB210]EWS75116.1 ATPase family AAA domain protein 3A [Tetrahymena thermophila SB210]|eukprot:XP_012652354.1 ATPase family AAA domain protein 3A [Tetrahymena thermophila SB210]
MSLNLDPNSLERAAEAIREIQKSPNAKLIYQGIIEQERALAFQRQAELEREKGETIKIRQEEARRTSTHEKEQKKNLEEYRDKLERKRFTEQLVEKQKRQEEINRTTEESIRRQEEIKLQSMEKQMKEQLKLEEKKAELLAKAKSQAYRQNFDLKVKEIIKKEEERRQTLKELAAITFDNFAHGIEYIQKNKGFAITIGIYTGLISLAFYLSKSSINLASKFLEMRLVQPSLVRETSRPTTKNLISGQSLRFINSFKSNKSLQDNIFSNIVLPQHLEGQLQSISYSILNKKRNLAPLRNMLIYGPPGTGKTLFAKKLAYSSNMDYAIMAGSDIAPLKENAVEAINKVFDWAEKSSRGIIIFIDEGDAFFRNRDDKSMSENVRNCINTFLYRTGTPSKNVMFVVATNYPEIIDKALNDRVDNYLYFPLPSADERFRLLNLFFSKYFDYKFSLLNEIKNIWWKPSSLIFRPKIIKQDHNIDEQFLRSIAEQTEGFSAREIEKFIIACHNSAFYQKEPSLDKNVVQMVLQQVLQEHKNKNQWVK